MLVSRTTAGAGGPALSNANPKDLGVPAPGVSTDASRADHVHPPKPPPVPLLAGVVTTVLGVDTVVGYGHIDPTGVNSLIFEAEGQVVAGVKGILDLYDMDNAAVVATLTWTETATTRKSVAMAVPGNDRTFELRVRKSGGGATDYALFSAAFLIGS